jgi:hypothetical protein
MKERPIIFAGAMVRAILDGKKTQTRRVIKPQPAMHDFKLGGIHPALTGKHVKSGMIAIRCVYAHQSLTHINCPYGTKKDRLWVREAWRHTANDIDEARSITEDIMSGTAIDWKADCVDRLMRDGWKRDDAIEVIQHEKWRPSIHMPRWASRITLEIIDIRVERLHDISEADAMNEGAAALSHFNGYDMKYIHGFRSIWESTDGPTSWVQNPWVWVIEFKKVEP